MAIGHILSNDSEQCIEGRCHSVILEWPASQAVRIRDIASSVLVGWSDDCESNDVQLSKCMCLDDFHSGGDE